MTGLGSAVRRGLIWSAIQGWGEFAVRFVVLLVLARLVGVQALGIFALAGACLSPLELLAGQGMSGALILRQSIDQRHIAAAAWSVALSGAAAAVAAILASPWIAAAFNEPQLMSVVSVLAPGIVLSATGTLAAALHRREFDFKSLALAAGVAQTVAAALAIGAALMGAGLWSLVIRQIAEQATTAIILWRRHIHAALAWPDRHYWRELSRLGRPVAAASLVPLLYVRGTELLIGYVLGVQALGYFALARRQVDAAAGLLPALITNISWPLFSRLQDDPIRLRAAMLKAVKILATVAFPAFGLMGGTARLWVPLLLGDAWLPTVPLIEALSAGAAVTAIVGLNLTALVAVGRGYRRVVLEVAAAALALTMIATALPFGLPGITIALLVTPVVMAPVQMALIRPVAAAGPGEQLRSVGPQTLAALIMLAALAGLYIALSGVLAAPFLLPLLLAAGGTVYVAVLGLVEPSWLRELRDNLMDVFRRAQPTP
jgi:PST family polysaccharide transporter